MVERTSEPTSEPDPRFVDLELRMMKLERFIQELSDVVADQQRTIGLLTADAKRVRERLAQGEQSREQAGEQAEGDERPPHY
jgi:SlyX protein